MRSGSPVLAKASALAPPPASTDRIMASSTGGSRSVACWIMRRSCQFFAFGSGTAFGWTVSTGSACTRGRPWGPCTRITGLRRATPSRSQESAFSLLLTASTRGSRCGVESYRCRTGIWGILVHSRESQEQLQAAAPDPRGPGKGLLRGHPGGAGGVGRAVLRGGDARDSPMESRPRAPDSALQVLRFPDGVVAGAGPSATRCPAHPATASAPHRAGGSTYVRSVALQRRTRPRAVEAPQAQLFSSNRHSAGTSTGAPLFFIKNTRNLAGLVLLAFRLTT